VIAADWIERVRAGMPELPRAMAERYVREHGLSAYDAAQLTQSPGLAHYFESAVAAGANAKLASNWITGEIARRLNLQDIAITEAPVTAAQLAALVGRIGDGTVSNNAARQVFDRLWTGAAKDVDAVIEAEGLKQVSDSGALEKIIDGVLAANPKSIDEYRAGKDRAFNALVGQVMKASQGKANPTQVNALLKARLG
jgi:aspartyl-tRNA(Asn)/glutamyl-tRNA(Gln) amidotransferase subunit B